MNDELFNPKDVTMDSPKLAWMKKHGIVTDEDKHHTEDSEDDRWYAITRHPDGKRIVGTGATEHDALADWSIKRGVRLWNEEGL